MSVDAEPIAITYKNQGEYGYKLGIAVIDEDSDPVTIPAGVNFIYYDTLGVKNTVVGARSANIAYYEALITDFLIPGSYRYWLECFTLDIYGPFELKILKV